MLWENRVKGGAPVFTFCKAQIEMIPSRYLGKYILTYLSQVNTSKSKENPQSYLHLFLFLQRHFSNLLDAIILNFKETLSHCNAKIHIQHNTLVLAHKSIKILEWLIF